MKHTIKTTEVYCPLVSKQTFNAIAKQFINKINWVSPGIDGDVVVELNGKTKEHFKLNEDRPFVIFSDSITAVTIPNEWDNDFIKLAESFN